jgi:hypothetical protein
VVGGRWSVVGGRWSVIGDRCMTSVRMRGRRLIALAVASSLCTIGVAVTSPAKAVPMRGTAHFGQGKTHIPVGAWAAIGSGWRMRVIAVRSNVNPQAAGYRRPYPGLSVYVVTLALRYTASGVGYISALLGDLELRGAHADYANAWAACMRPWSCTGGIVRVASGRTVAGNVCFQVERRDADSMKGLFASPPGTNVLFHPGIATWPPEPVEFALR